MIRFASILLVLAVVLTCTALSQFKSAAGSRPNVSESLVRPADPGIWFGLFDPSKLSMHHTFSLSYSTMAGQGTAIGVYTNSLFYKFSDPLDVQVDVSLVHSPYSSFGSSYQKDISGIYLSRAQLNYRPSENMLFQIQYRQVPPTMWWGDSFGSYWFLDRPMRTSEENR